MIDDGFQLLPEQASTHAPHVDLLYYSLLGLSALITVLVATLIVFFSIRFRRSNSKVDRTGIRDNVPILEVAWTVVPLVISMAIFGWGAKLYFTEYRPPAGAMEVHVVARQWMWKFQHPNGRRASNSSPCSWPRCRWEVCSSPSRGSSITTNTFTD